VKGSDELTIRVALGLGKDEPRLRDVVRQLTDISTDLGDGEAADASRYAIEAIDLTAWEEPTNFPWDDESWAILDGTDLVVAGPGGEGSGPKGDSDATAYRTALAYLAGRGIPVVSVTAGADESLRSRLATGLFAVIDAHRRRRDAACIAELGYSANGLALANAAALNQTTGVAALLRIGVSPDSVDAAGIPVLNRAIRAAAWECVELLLEAGSSVDRPAPDRDATPLMELASTRRHDLIHRCLERATEIDHSSGSGQTALTIAVGAKDTETALALLDRGANP
jgi:hypothetical protein